MTADTGAPDRRLLAELPIRPAAVTGRPWQIVQIRDFQAAPPRIKHGRRRAAQDQKRPQLQYGDSELLQQILAILSRSC